jgi:hypothetical protein
VSKKKKVYSEVFYSEVATLRKVRSEGVLPSTKDRSESVLRRRKVRAEDILPRTKDRFDGVLPRRKDRSESVLPRRKVRPEGVLPKQKVCTEMTHTESIIPRVLSRGPYARASSFKWQIPRTPPDLPSSEVHNHMPRDQSQPRVQFEELSQRAPYRVTCKIRNSK